MREHTVRECRSRSRIVRASFMIIWLWDEADQLTLGLSDARIRLRKHLSRRSVSYSLAAGLRYATGCLASKCCFGRLSCFF